MRTRLVATSVIDDLYVELRDRSYQYHPTPVALPSGLVSHHDVNVKNVFCTHRGMTLWAEWFRKTVLATVQKLDGVGGPLEGGVYPTLALTALERLPAFTVRPAAEPGGRAIVEGSLGRGRVVIVDDVITSGERTFRAVRAAEEHGLNVIGVACLLFRPERYVQDLRRYPLWAPWSFEAFLARLQEERGTLI